MNNKERLLLLFSVLLVKNPFVISATVDFIAEKLPWETLRIGMTVLERMRSYLQHTAEDELLDSVGGCRRLETLNLRNLSSYRLIKQNFICYNKSVSYLCLSFAGLKQPAAAAVCRLVKLASE